MFKNSNSLPICLTFLFSAKIKKHIKLQTCPSQYGTLECFDKWRQFYSHTPGGSKSQAA